MDEEEFNAIIAAINKITGNMETISLEEMASVKLMHRRDTKFLVHLAELPVILRKISDQFAVQEASGKKTASYETIYYETSLQTFFLEHVNGKLNRRKVRRRSYLDSDIHFLEVKRKTNKDKTIKHRVAVNSLPGKEDTVAAELVKAQAGIDFHTLTPCLANRFNRITLVNNQKTERVTIDFQVSFSRYPSEEVFNVNELAIIEIKQDKTSPSHVRDVLREMRIMKAGFSKYCFGMVLTGQALKTNRMKCKIRRIQKIIHHEYFS